MARNTNDPIAQLQAQLEAMQDALASVLPGAPGNESPKPATRRGGRKPASVKPNERKTARKPRNVPAACITAGDAWLALGGDPTYEPRDPDKPANNSQLWRLNQAGRLGITS